MSEAAVLFSGYACRFGRADLGRDLLLPGAFAASLASRGVAGIRLLYQHDPREPIGRFVDISEDALGLRVTGALLPEIGRAREVATMIRAGVLDGLSIGFRTVSGRRDARTGIRRLQAVDLWEISVVTFPMQPGARITGLQAAATLPPPTARPAPLSQPERRLRRAARRLRACAPARTNIPCNLS